VQRPRAWEFSPPTSPSSESYRVPPGGVSPVVVAGDLSRDLEAYRKSRGKAGNVFLGLVRRPPPPPPIGTPRA
jgi:hypothetical protein